MVLVAFDSEEVEPIQDERVEDRVDEFERQAAQIGLIRLTKMLYRVSSAPQPLPAIRIRNADACRCP